MIKLLVYAEIYMQRDRFYYVENIDHIETNLI